MADSTSLLSLPYILTATSKPPHPYISIHPRLIKLHLSHSSLSSKPLSFKGNKTSNFSSFTTLVARTSDWAQEQQDEEEEPRWENQGTDEWDTVAEAVEGEGESAEEGEPSEDAKLFVGNLPYDVDSQKLAMLFQKAGTVEIAEVIYNRETDRSRGFGFVTMSTVDESELAVEMFNRYHRWTLLCIFLHGGLKQSKQPRKSPKKPIRTLMPMQKLNFSGEQQQIKIKFCELAASTKSYNDPESRIAISLPQASSSHPQKGKFEFLHQILEELLAPPTLAAIYNLEKQQMRLEEDVCVIIGFKISFSFHQLAERMLSIKIKDLKCSTSSSMAEATKRYAVVTGANKGIGYEIVRQLTSNGVIVVLTARDEKRGLEAIEKLKQSGYDQVIFHQLDVADSASIHSLADFIQSQFGKLDILVNNAGIGRISVDGNALSGFVKV